MEQGRGFEFPVALGTVSLLLWLLSWSCLLPRRLSLVSLSLAAFLESDSQAANSHEARRDATSDTVLQRVASGPQAVLVTGQPPTPTPPCPPYTFP